jgi:hypothetical protein
MNDDILWSFGSQIWLGSRVRGSFHNIGNDKRACVWNPFGRIVGTWNRWIGLFPDFCRMTGEREAEKEDEEPENADCSKPIPNLTSYLGSSSFGGSRTDH